MTLHRSIICPLTGTSKFLISELDTKIMYEFLFNFYQLPWQGIQVWKSAVYVWEHNIKVYHIIRDDVTQNFVQSEEYEKKRYWNAGHLKIYRSVTLYCCNMSHDISHSLNWNSFFNWFLRKGSLKIGHGINDMGPLQEFYITF